MNGGFFTINSFHPQCFISIPESTTKFNFRYGRTNVNSKEYKKQSKCHVILIILGSIKPQYTWTRKMKSDIFFVEKGFIRDGEQLQPLFFWHFKGL